MRKENILVAALVVILVGGIFGYNSMKSVPLPDTESVTRAQAAVFDAAAGTALPASDKDILWKDYTPGMALARQENKSIFLYFHAPWCTYCTKLKKTTFRDERVLAYLNENFVSIQVNTDINQALADKWRVKGLPTMWFLEPDGKKIDRMPGYVEADRLLKVLAYIHTKSYATMAFSEFMKQ